MPMTRSPLFHLEAPRHNPPAIGQEVDGLFFVLRGSKARADWVGTDRGFQSLFEHLIDNGILVHAGGGELVFNDDYPFSSPCNAASAVCGYRVDGRNAWVVEGPARLTYADWQEQLLNKAVPSRRIERDA
ncbi:DUF4357 domain-containing protein [Pseudomonas fragi]|uniref:DUF4357 domain-containing protein n=1 Tax=Pseudomonas fragi TaxID=296 RepID=A0A9Q5FP12_PSEFR|nr:DUF4357 domain-containing protein [Pseudomonas fragi]NNB48533.1 DUF4357 domain-containing protein [Pseudomonas fragi]